MKFLLALAITGGICACNRDRNPDNAATEPRNGYSDSANGGSTQYQDDTSRTTDTFRTTP